MSWRTISPSDAPGHGRGDAGRMDEWLERKLKALHDEVVGEPLPPALQSLIDAIER